MKRVAIVACALYAEFERRLLRDGGVVVVAPGRLEQYAIGASPSSIIVDEVPQFEMPRPVSNLYGNPRPYLKRKKGRS